MLKAVASAKFEEAKELISRGHADRARVILEDVLNAFPANSSLHFLLGLSFESDKRHDEALARYDRALEITPTFAIVHFNRGITLHALKRTENALASYDRALSLGYREPEIFYNRANILGELGLNNQALESYNKAIELRPGYIEALFNRGFRFYAMGSYDLAVEDLNKVISIKPDMAEAYAERGLSFYKMGRRDSAVSDYKMAITLKPTYAKPHFNLANALLEAKLYEEAAAHYSHALLLDPNLSIAHSMKLLCKMHVCDWDRFNVELDEILSAVTKGSWACMPFTLLGLPSTLAQQRTNAERFARNMLPQPKAFHGAAALKIRDKIRVGYFSADFHNHATAHLMAELFERHNRSQFDVIGFSYGESPDDDMRRRLSQGFDQLHELRNRDDNYIVEKAKAEKIDIAIDLKGYTNNFRLGFFAHRLAPIQVHYLGYPGTLGTACIDYLIADETIIPPEHLLHYSEKIAYLPSTYQVNDRKRRISTSKLARADFGLPDSAVVFCSFNNNFKILPETFDTWMRVLKSVENSALWLLGDNPQAEINLKREAQQRGVEPARIIFAPRMDLPQHLARHHLADIGLDTFIYNGHTTTSDALWAGLPVVTCMGDTFAGRVGCSLVAAAGLPELACAHREAYVETAIRLAVDRDKLRVLKARLEAQRENCPLFDVQLFTRNLEELYIEMWSRYTSGLQPDHLRVLK